ncbi:MAG: leucine-rich repeat protein [Candidatus Cloacimonetes bacterium]|nr:leucine-rich repeat protein [Candidatus Cloacimonadota bacterium]
MSENNFTKPNINFEVYNGSNPFLFVSYSHTNTDIVYKILNKLDSERFRIWYDDTMEIGSDFREELRTRIEKCGAFILFISTASMQSKYVGMEIITAFKYDKRIYPIYLESDAEIPNSFKLLLENLQHLKGYSTDGNDKYIDNLVASLPIETMRQLIVKDGVLTKCKDGSKEIILDESIKTIADSAFKHCRKLESIVFSKTVTYIGNEAFRGCSRLKKLFIPQTVLYIGDSAFRDCIDLTDLVIEKEIDIAERAFENCPQLKNISLPDDLIEINNGVFNSCCSLDNIKLPEDLAVLGENALSDCISLKRITLSPNVIMLNNRAFAGCINLEDIVLSEELTKITHYVFLNCSSLETIYIPSKVNEIGIGPFKGCSKLHNIIVDPKNRYFRSTDGILFNKNKSTLLIYPSNKDFVEYEVPDSVTNINGYAFYGAIRLKKIILHDSLNTINIGAFSNCTSIEKIEIPDGVTKIDDSVFRGCINLKEISIPPSVVDFGWEIFRGCKKITVICNDNEIAASYCEKNQIKYVRNKKS